MPRHVGITYVVAVEYEEPVDIDEARGAFLLAIQSYVQDMGGLGGYDGETITKRITVDCSPEKSRFEMDLKAWSFEFVEVFPGK